MNRLKIIGIVCAVSMMAASFALAIQPDAYEEDNTPSHAEYISTTQVQRHNFHAAGDQDWVKFYGFSGQIYSITATNAGSNCDPALKLYSADGVTLLKQADDAGTGVGETETIEWTCSVTGVYYVKVSNADASVFGDGTEYDLKVVRPAGNNGNIKGVIYDHCTSQKVSGVKITVSGSGINDSFINPFVGDYLISLVPNTSYTIKFEAAGYQVFQAQGITVKPDQEFTGIDIYLEPLVKYTYYKDADGDGYGDPKNSTQTCTSALPAGYVANNTDCNDADAAIHPGATEICDGKDNNCNGQIDEGCQVYTYYRDADGDGCGDPKTSTQSIASTPPAGYVTNNTDCNDADAAVHPGETEICDGKDNNCNGQIDEGLPTNTYYRDADGDGYGDLKNSIQSCSATPPAGYVSIAGDCNDADASVHPTLSLSDAIAILRILSEIPTEPPICLKDHRLEMGDVLHILQIVSELR